MGQALLYSTFQDVLCPDESNNHRHFIMRSNGFEGASRSKITLTVNILLTMPLTRKYLPRFSSRRERTSDLHTGHVMIQNFLHRGSGFNHRLSPNALSDKIAPSVFGKHQVNVTRVVNDFAVDLLRHPLVETAVARFIWKMGILRRLAAITERLLLVSPRTSTASGLIIAITSSDLAITFPMV